MSDDKAKSTGKALIARGKLSFRGTEVPLSPWSPTDDAGTGLSSFPKQIAAAICGLAGNSPIDPADRSCGPTHRHFLLLRRDPRGLPICNSANFPNRAADGRLAFARNAQSTHRSEHSFA